ncbi:MAG: hypothetical protein K9K67_01285 [Bacteriovoracaceae bacterium]|nr:hypothetical protein [Bacteriovoracaceae bacterium]
MASNSSNIEFVLFGKAPRYGLVKTRLFPDNPEKCLLLYKAFFKDFLSRYSIHCDLPLRPLLDLESELEKTQISEILGGSSLNPLEIIFQNKLGFFERIAEGLSQIETPFFYLTGTDLPHFPFHFIKDLKMESKIIYLGPDNDGGIYFVAGPREAASCFEINSAPENVGTSLVRSFQNKGYEVKLLNEWSDIDTMEDLQNCLEMFGPDELPCTYEALHKLKANDQEFMPELFLSSRLI